MLPRLIVFVTGIAILGFGVAMIIVAGLGATAWDSVFVGFADRFGLSVGTWVFIVQFTLMFVNAVLLRKKPEWLSVINIVLTGASIDLWLFLLQDMPAVHPAVNVLLLAAGLVCLGAGIAVYLKSGLPKSQIDGLMLAFHTRFGLSLRWSRTLVELTGIGIGLTLGGPVGIGTVAALIALGPLIQWFYSHMPRLDAYLLPTNKQG